MGHSPALASPPEEYRAELHSVLQSELFSRSPALANLLSYVCEKTLAGESHQIKEYTIAVEVFGRRVDYDQEADSIVRVEAARLRKRLKQYYDGPGATHTLQITIPVGQYVPSLVRKEAAGPVTQESPRQDEAVLVDVAASATQAEEASVTPPKKIPGARRSTWMLAAIAGALVIIIIVLLLALVLRSPSNSPTASTPAPALPSDVVNGIPAGDELRILCGSDRQYIDRSGKTWSADQYFTGGTPVHSSAAHIWRTPDAELYRNSRQGDFAYDIPLKAGVYELHLHFSENYYGPEEPAGGGEGSRLVGVSANGDALVSSLDIVADAGASRTADEKVFTNVRPAKDGILHLKFWSTHGGRGMVSAIAILPGRDKKIRPIRIVTRESAYYSNDSRWWSPDLYFKGGQIGLRNEPVNDSDDPELYESERWGNFSYAIPVPPGRYTVAMSFVERCGPGAREGCIGNGEDTATGTRTFNVLCNSKFLLRDFNILKEAGGVRRVVEKKFTGLEPNAQGKLLLEFIPTKGYATVTSVEVLPE